MPHFQLIDPSNPTSLVSKISKQGPGSFYVKPTSKNNGLVPINGKAIVDILGKKVNISLVHKEKEGDDPEPSVPKWSYFKELYSNDSPLTPVPANLIKNFQTCYVFATAGDTTYSGTPGAEVRSTTLRISKPFTIDDNARDYAPSSTDIYSEDSNSMELCQFRMFYKQPIIDPDTGDVIIPDDDDTPESNRLRLPCNVDIANTPSWITNIQILFYIELYNNGSLVDTLEYNSWVSFRADWETYRVNIEDYTDVNFYYKVIGKVATNSDTVERTGSGGPNTITIQEAIGDGGKLWGAKPIYLLVGQLGGYKRIKLYYKQATTSEVTVPGPNDMSPGTAQISNHNLWLQGEACGVYSDQQGDDIITLNKLTGKGVANSTSQDHYTLEFSDSSKNRTEYFYIGNPFFLGFVEETNLYKDNVGINLWDNRSSKDFWHNLYFTVISEKCSYDPSWYNVGMTPHLYQGTPSSISNIGYTILFPWAVKSGNSWKSLYEIPTAVSNGELDTNSHRILAQNWIQKSLGDPRLNKDTIKSTSDILYGGAVSIHSVNNKDKTNGEGWNFNPDKINTGIGTNRLRNYLEYVAQQWDNTPNVFGSSNELRNVTEILFVPMFVTAHKLCPDNPINGNNINSMVWGNSLIPETYNNHEGYARYIGLFPPTINNWY